MVYVYKKIIGNRPYYYLRASGRKGKRLITKDIAYLGSSIEEVKKNIANPKYKQKVRKAYKTINSFINYNHYLEKVQLLKLKKDAFLDKKLNSTEACEMHYAHVFKRLDQTTKSEILNNFIIDFAFNTTSIEGNTITLQQTKSLLDDNLTPKNKTLREIYDLQNTKKVFFDILNSNEELSQAFIIKIHSELMKNIDARLGYRQMDVRVIKSNFDATPYPYIKIDMGLLLKWYAQYNGKLHPLALAVIFHHKFEKIHPFMDGNGRVGRMLLNYILLKNNYPPLVIHKKKRADYLEALRKSDKADLTKSAKNDYFQLVQFSADEMIETYWNIFL